GGKGWFAGSSGGGPGLGFDAPPPCRDHTRSTRDSLSRVPTVRCSTPRICRRRSCRLRRPLGPRPDRRRSCRRLPRLRTHWGRGMTELPEERVIRYIAVLEFHVCPPRPNAKVHLRGGPTEP